MNKIIFPTNNSIFGQPVKQTYELDSKAHYAEQLARFKKLYAASDSLQLKHEYLMEIMKLEARLK